MKGEFDQVKHINVGWRAGAGSEFVEDGLAGKSVGSRVWAWFERVLACREVGSEGSIVPGEAVGLVPGWVNKYGVDCGCAVVVRVEVEEKMLERGEEGSG